MATVDFTYMGATTETLSGDPWSESAYTVAELRLEVSYETALTMVLF